MEMDCGLNPVIVADFGFVVGVTLLTTGACCSLTLDSTDTSASLAVSSRLTVD